MVRILTLHTTKVWKQNVQFPYIKILWDKFTQIVLWLLYGISLFGMTMCFWVRRRHLEWRIKIVVLLKTCPGLIRKRYSCFMLQYLPDHGLFPRVGFDVNQYSCCKPQSCGGMRRLWTLWVCWYCFIFLITRHSDITDDEIIMEHGTVLPKLYNIVLILYFALALRRCRLCKFVTNLEP